jgi:hypothetical protein
MDAAAIAAPEVAPRTQRATPTRSESPRRHDDTGEFEARMLARLDPSECLHEPAVVGHERSARTHAGDGPDPLHRHVGCGVVDEGRGELGCRERIEGHARAVGGGDLTDHRRGRNLVGHAWADADGELVRYRGAIGEDRLDR